jgi:RNA polymerase sigma factor (sigma-70 family)
MDQTPNGDWWRIVIERVERFLAGDKAAVDGPLYLALYQRGEGVLRGTIACREIRSNLLREGIFRFWRALETGNFKGPPEHAPAYYKRVIENLRRDVSRSRKRRRVLPTTDAFGPDGDGLDSLASKGGQDQLPPLDASIRQEILEQVRRCVQKLPPELRGLIELRFWEGLALRPLAEQVGTTTSQVRTLLGKAYRCLTVCLRKAAVDL